MPQIKEQWNRLQAMRAARDGTPAPKSVPVEGEQPDIDSEAARELAETPRESTTEQPPAPAAEQPQDSAIEQTPAPAAEQPRGSETKEPEASAAPQGEEIEVEGIGKVVVDPTLAAAFKEAERVKADAKKDEERQRLKAELREELKAELAPAESIADKMLREAEEAAKRLPPKPDHKLLITDPEEYERQRDAYEEARLDLRMKQSEAKRIAEQQKSETVQRQSAEAEARAILREQFFMKYGALRDSKLVVEPLLQRKFDDVVASGVLAKPMTVEQREQFKQAVFADVAAKATAEIVRIAHAGKKIAPPPPPPPTTVSSAPVKAPKPKEPAVEKPRDKYPKGTISALLRAHQQRKVG